MNLMRLAAAQEYYENLGYKNIEVPWVVDKDVNLITAPPNPTLYPLENKFLVASAEQSFIQSLKDGKLPPGRYQATTPCFRDDELDELHQRYFMKLELFDNTRDGDSYMRTVLDSQEFFSKYVTVERKLTAVGMDLESGGIELGSYGVRETPYGKFVYGTGCAEPRLGYAIKVSPGDLN